MNHNSPEDVYQPSHDGHRPSEGIILAELVDESPSLWPPRARPRRRSWRLPLVLFVLTCVSALLAGSGGLQELLLEAMINGQIPQGVTFGTIISGLTRGLYYAVPLMIILVFHEMGHFLQARRYGVPASLPFFLPMPLSPIGTMGAVIGMAANMGDRRALFDIGITGPLAGLVPTLIFCIAGLQWSHVAVLPPDALQFGDPLLLRFMVWIKFGPIPPGHDVVLHPMAFAGWVGLLVTSLNLIPIGQLDGGHILYALLRKKAHRVASMLLTAAGAAVVVGTVVYGYPIWILMVLLLFVMGPIHPPTANDNMPLGPIRIVLGWLTLAFIIIGFTPMPIKL